LLSTSSAIFEDNMALWPQSILTASPAIAKFPMLVYLIVRPPPKINPEEEESQQEVGEFDIMRDERLSNCKAQ
jgi:hypothetical protein